MIEEKKKLIESFSDLDVSDKRKELGREVSESIVMVYKLLADITEIKNMPNMDDFNNLYNGIISEDEYLTGLYEHFINYKELLAIYLSKVLHDKYK